MNRRERNWPSPFPPWGCASEPADRKSTVYLLALFAVWLFLALYQILQHEIWRDEVIALSYAKAAVDIRDLITNPPRDGHPIVWTMCLHIAYKIFQTNLVLPALNFLFAAAAILIFLFRSPFGWPFLIIFVFSSLAINEYPVLARNYAISFLLMFLFTALYVEKKHRPLLLGGILFILANTNVHSALLSLGFLFCWCCDWLIRRRNGQDAESVPRMIAAATIALTGVLICFLSVYPHAHDAITPEFSFTKAVAAIALPGHLFSDTFEPLSLVIGWKLAWAAGTALLFTIMVGLIKFPTLAVAAAGATLAFALFFSLVYGGAYRHQALLLIFFVCLYWISLKEIAAGNRRMHVSWKFGLCLTLPSLFLIQNVSAAQEVVREITMPFSSSAKTAGLIKNTSSLENAIIFGVPDYIVEALPYYLPNDLYLPRQKKFGKTVLYSRRFPSSVTLQECLDLARRLRTEHGKPVVILMNPRLDKDIPPDLVRREAGLQYTATEVRIFLAATRKIAELRNTIEVSESYDLYVLK